MRLRLCILLVMCMMCSANRLLGQTASEKTRIAKLESQLQNSNEAVHISILCDIADLYCRHNPDKAIEYLDKAERLCLKKEFAQNAEMSVWRGYGNAYYYKQSFKKAVSAFEKAAELAQKGKQDKVYAYSLYNIGVSHLGAKNYKKAISSLGKSLIQAKKIKDNSLCIKLYKALYETHNLNKDYKEAVQYYKLFVGSITGNSTRLNPEVSVLMSSYRGEPRLHLLSDYELNDKDQRLVEMDSALTEQSHHYEELEKESMLKIKELNEYSAAQDSMIYLHQKANMQNQQLINEQKKQISIYVSLVVVILIGLIVSSFMWNKIRKDRQRLANQNTEIERQKHLIELKNEQITDSINYARKIQDSILVPESKIQRYLPDMFIYFKPKDIVSGDFYWFSKLDSKYVITAIDCTGHGVPGAFLSMIGNTLLHEIVNIKHVFKPDQILSMLHNGIMLALNQDSEDGSSEDGMDMSLCTVDTRLHRFQFAGAKNSLYVVQGNKLNIFKANYYSIGGRPLRPDMNVEFTCYDFMYDDSTSIYMFSDGYLDQFGGETGEKFNTQRFKDMILENRDLPMQEQKEVFTRTMEEWRGGRQQIDDFLVMGIKLSCVKNFEKDPEGKE